MTLKLLIVGLFPLLTSPNLFGQNNLAIWREFLSALKSGELTETNIRPHDQLGNEHRKVLLGYLDSLRTQATPNDWITEPEIIRTDQRIQFIAPWSTHGQKISYCFSFVTEGARWYFQHLEAIFIRLDKIGQLPTSEFPDISSHQKSWAREEIFWSFVLLNVYLPTVEARGKDVALTMLKDGPGYFVGAKTWVPFASPQNAFILYLCWEQARLRGTLVTLEKLEEHEAIVRLQSHFLALYSVASHLRSRITSEDYRAIFETIWHDRALSAGWRLAIEYFPDHSVVFRFFR